MKLSELLETSTPKKKVQPIKNPVKNPVAKNAKISGAGPHEEKKYNRKEKHKIVAKDE